MYILKNAWTNIRRNKGRNILIAIIVIVITSSSCVALAINTSGNKLIQSYKDQNKLEVSFKLNMKQFRQHSSDESQTTIDKLTIDDIKKYGDSNYVSSYYYTYETSLSSESINAVDMSEVFTKPDGEDKKPDNRGGNQGDFKITAYSEVSYIENFVNGTSKITSGAMITNEDEENNIVISEDLAEENNLEVGSTVTMYLPSDSLVTYEFKIVGIFETNSSDNNFMNMSALNSQNQIYTTTTAMNEILENDNNSNSLNSKFYLKNSNDLEDFTKEVKEKGLSDYYQVSDNTDQILSTLKPIQNISSFSLTFLIIILIVGAIILAVINMINIRERKYEIGVLRAIGMSKKKVILQLIIELFIIAVMAFVIGTSIGYALSQPVTNKMLESEINSYQNQSTQTRENFGGEKFRGSENFMDSSNYVDTLIVTLEAQTILKLFGVSMLLVIISGVVAVIFVIKYEPNKILQNRN